MTQTTNKILVIGDTILDHYLNIKPKKISDEAHVITSEICNSYYSLGGGANVARNITSQGYECTYIGLTSQKYNNIITKLFKEMDVNAILFSVNDSIEVKTRILSNNGNQVFRLDTNCFPKIKDLIYEKIINMIDDIIVNYDFIIISKYYDHFINYRLSQEIIKLCKKYNKKIIVDNRQNNYKNFSGADFYKVNFNEFKSLFNLHSLNNNTKEITKILKKTKLPFNYLIITRSSEPTIVYSTKNKDIIEIGVEKVLVNDVSGAGDTFVATFAINYNDNVKIEEIIKICHKFCNIVVKKLGTSVVWSYEYENNLDISLISKQLKKNNKKVVFTNGCFDILHEGHIRILEESKKMGDYLIVGLNSDKSIKLIKGELRPIKNQDERKRILESIKFVDKVIIFDETNVNNLLKKIKPNIYVKGSDYSVKNLPEKESLKFVDSIKFVKLVKDKSTSKIISKIMQDKNEK